MIKLSKDICEVCMKQTAPKWIGVKDEKAWCTCMRQKDNGGMWIYTSTDEEGYSKERMKRAVELYIEWLFNCVEVRYRLIDTKKKTLYTVEDKWKDMLLLEREDGKRKWFKKKSISNLKIKRRIE